MTPTTPYLIRAIFDWVVDNDMTPHVLVDANSEGVQVPTQYVENGVIILNVSPTAVRDLELGNDAIEFNARFAGAPYSISVPVAAVKAIYARENGQGIVLSEHKEQGEVGSAEPQKAAGEEAPARQVPHLTIVE